MPGAPGSPKAAIAAGDVGLVQGLRVVAQQLTKYAVDGLQTNGGEIRRAQGWPGFFFVLNGGNPRHLCPGAEKVRF